MKDLRKRYAHVGEKAKTIVGIAKLNGGLQRGRRGKKSKPSRRVGYLIIKKGLKVGFFENVAFGKIYRGAKFAHFKRWFGEITENTCLKQSKLLPKLSQEPTF